MKLKELYVGAKVMIKDANPEDCFPHACKKYAGTVATIKSVGNLDDHEERYVPINIDEDGGANTWIIGDFAYIIEEDSIDVETATEVFANFFCGF